MRNYSDNKKRELLISALEKYLPETLTDGEINFDTLRETLGMSEYYEFTWAGKQSVRREADAPVTHRELKYIPEKSFNPDNTENIYIEGDNLDALKLLRSDYGGKVKVIYIDPPYNTGNKLVYNDDFSLTNRELAEMSGRRVKGPRFREDLKKGSLIHTNWLNMIYPRLKVSRELLADNGIIFISIGEREIHNLRQICDEIFGAENYLNQLIWVSNITGRQISGHGAAKTYEYILVYAKDIRCACSFSVDIFFARNKMPDAYKGFKKDIREDERGKFAVGDTLYNHNRKFNEETRPNLVFSIFYNPLTGEIRTGEVNDEIEGFIKLPPHPNGDGIHKYHAWRWSKEKIARESYNLIVLPVKKGYEIYTRVRNFNKTLLKDLITNISNGDKELQKLFGDKKYFDYPKSVDLIKLLIGSVKENDIVLDFFSGSSTTAHAVMELNAEDGGKRKFILVQLPENPVSKSGAERAGYKNICEIGEERIRRAVEKIRKDNPNAVFDDGFKVFEVADKNAGGNI
ncbi:MAG: site-specific DNA-methyltransferase [Ruminococcus sp.]|nr:site-specific DNA-methyltransferase [Ruminococcus sp.]